MPCGNLVPIRRTSGHARATPSSAKLEAVTPMSTLFRIPEVQGVTKATAKQQMLKQLVCTNAPEQALRYHGFRTIAGVDEVGRGALFGPVVAAAVILPEKVGVLSRMGLTDSKQLDRKQREKLDRKVRKMALAVSVVAVDAETIDRINIYQASRLAMRPPSSSSPSPPTTSSSTPCASTTPARRPSSTTATRSPSPSPPPPSSPRSTATRSAASSTSSSRSTASPATRATPPPSTAGPQASTAPARCTAAASLPSSPPTPKPPSTPSSTSTTCSTNSHPKSSPPTNSQQIL